MKKNPKKSRFAGNLLFVTLIFLASAAILIFIFRNNPVVYPYFSKLYSETLSVSKSGRFQSDNVAQTAMCDDKLVYYDSDSLYNEDGWSYKIKMTNPYLRSAGACLMIYSCSENRAEIFSGYKKIYTVKEKQGIQLADISRSGNSVVVSKEPGYHSKVTVYDNSGKNVFRAFFGEKYVIDATLSDDGEKVALCLLDIRGDEIVSTVAFYKISEKEPYATKDDTKTAFTNIGFFSNDKAIAIGDNKAMGFDSSGTAIWRYSYDGATLQHYSFGGSDKAVICLKKGGQSVVCIDTDGDNYSYNYTDTDIKFVDINDDSIMAVTPRKVLFITTHGMLIAGKDITMDVKGIHMKKSGRGGLVIHNFGYDKFVAK